MRKLLFIIVLIACPILGKAQNGIYLDSIHADGAREVQTTYYQYTNLLDDPVVLIGLTEFIKDNKCQTLLNVQLCRSYTVGAVPKGGRLLIKYDNDSILELHAEKRYEPKVIRNQHLLIASYPITFPQVMKLMLNVNRIRLETVIDNITVDVNPHLSLSSIADILRALNNRINKKGNDGFKDNF